MSWVEGMAGMMGGAPAAGGQLKLAVMTGPNTCKIGNLNLTAQDLMFADHLLQAKCTKVKETAPGGGGLCTDQSAYLPALAAGDTVLVYQLSDDRFLILERMVKSG